MSKTIHRIIMSKTVASRYLENISETGRTLTVYFPAESSQRSFIASVRDSPYGPNVSVSEGFDQATFMSINAGAVGEVETMAEAQGFDWTDF